MTFMLFFVRKPAKTLILVSCRKTLLHAQQTAKEEVSAEPFFYSLWYLLS